MAIAENTEATLESSGRMMEATEFLRRAAAGGSIAAIAALGKHLLIHRPDCAGEGLVAIHAATQAGHGEAAHLLAVFIAAGIGFPQSWEAALDALQRSAELEWQPAQYELAALANAFVASPDQAMQTMPPTRDWKAVRERVDVGSFIAASPTRAISEAPRIFVSDAFASPALCDWLIALGRPRLKPAQTWNPATGAVHYESGRTNSDSHLILPHGDLVLALLRARIASTIRLPVANLELPTILHYAPGQEFAPHYDFLNDSWPAYAQEIAKGGQRVLTFLLYLNDGFEGGETDFPLARTKYRGRKGDALFFWNVLPDGSVDRQTLHAGLPPTSGEKWLLSQWVRNRAA